MVREWFGQLAMRWTLALDRQLQRAHDLALRAKYWYNNHDYYGYDDDVLALGDYNHAWCDDDDDDPVYYIDHAGRLYHIDDDGRRVYYEHGV
jgi:hypothetical protein